MFVKMNIRLIRKFLIIFSGDGISLYSAYFKGEAINLKENQFSKYFI
jgi:hypothetical protein